uniref:Uncharacterized protein n=1 Tax=Schizaphis graminum TaxID=13262 RepID=A0A2S2PIX8_SCHGA
MYILFLCSQHYSHHFFYSTIILVCCCVIIFLSSATVDRISIETHNVLVVMIFYQSNESGTETARRLRILLGRNTAHFSYVNQMLYEKLFISFFFCICLKN